MRTNIERVSRRQWYAAGGLKNSALFRRSDGRCWHYYVDRRHLR